MLPRRYCIMHLVYVTSVRWQYRRMPLGYTVCCCAFGFANIQPDSADRFPLPRAAWVYATTITAVAAPSPYRIYYLPAERFTAAACDAPTFIAIMNAACITVCYTCMPDSPVSDFTCLPFNLRC